MIHYSILGDDHGKERSEPIEKRSFCGTKGVIPEGYLIRRKDISSRKRIAN